MALTQLQDSDQILKDLEALERELRELKSHFEQYFLGIEKRPPADRREKVVSYIRKYAAVHIRNARLKFRYQQAVAGYNSYSLYWHRVLREIEEGKYRRDVFKVEVDGKLHKGEPAARTPPEEAHARDPLDALYEQYVAGRKRCRESVAGLTPEKFRKALEGQIRAVKEKTRCADVALSVVVEGGKTKLRAAPKRAAKKPPAPPES